MTTEAPSVLQDIRRRHTLDVLEALTSGAKSRRELESDVGLSRTTLTAIVSELLVRGVITQEARHDYRSGRNGRPAKVLMLNPAVGASLGIELGRSQVSFTLLGFDGRVVLERQIPTPGSFDLEARLHTAVVVLKEMIAAGAVGPDALMGVGVGMAARHADPRCPSDSDRRKQSDPEGMSLQPLRAVLGSSPLTWDNNVRLATVAEHNDHDDSDHDLLYVSLSAGISCGLLVNGSIIRGGGIAGELGHLSVDMDGPKCWCGGQGCLESYLGSAAVLTRVRGLGLDCNTITDLSTAVQRGDPTALELVQWCGRMLGAALSNAIMLLDPSRITLGGELADLGEPLLDATVRAAENRQLRIGGGQRSFSLSNLGKGAASLGAAQAALETYGRLHELA